MNFVSRTFETMKIDQKCEHTIKSIKINNGNDERRDEKKTNDLTAIRRSTEVK